MSNSAVTTMQKELDAIDAKIDSKNREINYLKGQREGFVQALKLVEMDANARPAQAA